MSQASSRPRRRPAPPVGEQTTWARTFTRLLANGRRTQQDVSDATGIDKNTLSALVHGRSAKVETLARLAEYFGVDLAEFFLDEQEARFLTYFSPRRRQLVRGDRAKDMIVRSTTDLDHLAKEITDQMSTMMSVMFEMRQQVDQVKQQLEEAPTRARAVTPRATRPEPPTRPAPHHEDVTEDR